MKIANNLKNFSINSQFQVNEKLKKASEEFVAQFFFQIFKKMYNTIPKSKLIPESLGEKWFRENLLYEYSKKVANGDLKSLTNEVYRSLGGKMYSEYYTSKLRPNKKVEIKEK